MVRRGAGSVCWVSRPAYDLTWKVLSASKLLVSDSASKLVVSRRLSIVHQQLGPSLQPLYGSSARLFDSMALILLKIVVSELLLCERTWVHTGINYGARSPATPK